MTRIDSDAQPCSPGEDRELVSQQLLRKIGIVLTYIALLNTVAFIFAVARWGWA